MYVRFEGAAGIEICSRLQAKAKEIDDLIEGDLVWDWPGRTCFAVCEEEVDFSDRHDWEIQHAWFCEELVGHPQGPYVGTRAGPAARSRDRGKGAVGP